MITSKPLVSIILPVYNSKINRLSYSIESVLSQSYKNFELIIINDASTNDIEKTILQYKKQDPRIIYMKNIENVKLTKSLNKALSYANGDYIARIDDDDIRIDKDKLKKQIDFMELHPDYSLSGTSVIVIDEKDTVIKKTTQRENNKEIRENILQSNQFAHSSIVIRKSILDKVGYYNPDYNLAEDYELWCRIARISKVHNLPDFCIQYRVNTNSVSNKNIVLQKKIALKVFRKNRKYYPNFVKALLLRIGDYILPTQVIQKLLKISKNYR